jgi:YhcH/YjgK/YiaL family protein
MVTDLISNARLYMGLGPFINRALAWVAATDLTKLPVGRQEIDGDNVFALVSEYKTKAMADGKWETHRRYLDLQCVLSGIEQIGYAPASTLAGGDYTPDKDITFLTGTGNFIVAEPGRFMLLWPDDAHMPGMAIGESVPVRKVVVKIRMV